MKGAKYLIGLSIFLLTSCAGIPISRDPYVSPTSGPTATIKFITDISKLNQYFVTGAARARVSEKSCREIDGIDRNKSKWFSSSDFDRSQNTVHEEMDVVIPADKKVFFSWEIKRTKLTGGTFVGAGGLYYPSSMATHDAYGGVFIPEEGAKYESILTAENNQKINRLYKIYDDGSKSEIQYVACKYREIRKKTEENDPSMTWGLY